MRIRAYAASESKSEFKEFDYDPGELGDDEVEIAVDFCGVCHSALQFLNRWGYELSAISTSPDKEEVARDFGAHEFINAKADGELVQAEDFFDFILVTANAALPWDRS